MKLTILIPTLPQRKLMLEQLMQQFTDQLGDQIQKPVVMREAKYSCTTYFYNDVKVVTCMDRKQLTVGKKRNVLKTLVDTDYFTYIDDDDQIAPNYFEKILAGIETGKDLIIFKAQMFSKGTLIHNVNYHPRYTKDFNVPASTKTDKALQAAIKDKSKSWRTRIINSWPTTANRIPNHLMVWRSELAKHTHFPDVNIGEDGAWAKTMKPRVSTLHEIDDVLYYYMFDADTTETQRR